MRRSLKNKILYKFLFNLLICIYNIFNMKFINFNNHDIFNLSGKIFYFVGLLLLVSLYTFSFNSQFLLHVEAKSNDCDRKDSNVIVGTRPVTLGTECNDVIIACPAATEAVGLGVGSPCGAGNILRGFEKDDVLQGSQGTDELYGDEGNDQILGGPGVDKLYGGPGSDVLQSGEGSDLLIGANGDDELYGGPGEDVSIGGKGANYFDCGDGNDVIVDFDPEKGDAQSGNCEVILSRHGDMNIFVQSPKIKSQLEAFGIGSSKDEMDINDLGKTIND
jgi:hypothetical protein